MLIPRLHAVLFKKVPISVSLTCCYVVLSYSILTIFGCIRPLTGKMHDIRHSQQPQIAVDLHSICATADKYDNWHSLGAVGSQKNSYLLLHNDVGHSQASVGFWGAKYGCCWHMDAQESQVCLCEKWMYLMHLLTLRHVNNMSRVYQ